MSQSSATLPTAARGAQVSLRADVLPLVAAVLMSAIFVVSGLGKIAQPQQTIGYIASTGAPFPAFGYALAVVVELGGSLALLLGYRARTAALVLAAYSIATAVMFHTKLADQNQFIHLLKNVAMAGGFLQIAAFGRGRLSLGGRSA